MAINDLTITDIYSVANAVVTKAQGGTASANTSDFTTLAQLALKSGYDPLATAISQVLSKTIFSYRPYSAKFQGLEKDAIQWGNHVRKLNPIDKPLEQDNRLLNASGTTLDDGDTLDQYVINKPEVLQSNFYGAETYQKHLTIWKDQLDTAFNTPEQFGNFLTMVMGSASDQLEQVRESMARGALVNLIGGTITLNNTGSVVHLLTEYNSATGQSLTATTVLLPANYRPFMQWVFARLQSIMDRMTDRTSMYHLNPVGNDLAAKTLLRHTPIRNQHAYFLSDFINQSAMMAMSDTFHDQYLKVMDYEKLNFWMNAANPSLIQTTVNYLTKGTAGTTASAITTASINNSTVVGVVFDDEAIGITNVNQWAQATPFNARGGYYNQYWHETRRWWNDNTENVVVFCLD